MESNLKEFLTGIETRESNLEQFEFAREFSKRSKIEFFIYTDDSLTLWTYNRFPVSVHRDTLINDGNIVLAFKRLVQDRTYHSRG
jgi:hypothetical protein